MVLEASFAAASSSSMPWIFLLGGLTGLAVLLLRQTRWLLHQLWWQPRHLERALRAQGVRGTSYRFPAGDLREYVGLAKEAWSKPGLPLRCHDTARRVTPFLHRLLQEYGKTSVSWFGPVPKVTIFDAELARDVLSNKLGHLEKLKFPALFKIMGHGVANHDGEKWAKHRRILNPAFHVETLKRMKPAFSACCQELVSRWQESLGSDGACELDVWPELQNFTGDVISRTAFSSSYREGTRIFQLQAEQALLVMTNIRTVMIPGYLSLPTANNRKILKNNKEVESILRDIVGKRIQAMKQGESTKDDLLGLLLESNMRDTDGMGMTIEDVIEECKLFYFAGTETSSVMLTWTLVLLSMHPEWQDRARDEVTGLFGKNMPDYEGLSRLKIVTMVLYEVLRLYPPVCSIARKTYKEVEIGGVTYPAGVLLEVPVLFIHHDPDIWGSDVHEFRPDRFAEGISKASKDSGAFLPFGWGPRYCIGQNFAMLEAKMALCMILQRFEFQLAPSYTHAPHTVITMHPMHGVQLKLRAL